MDGNILVLGATSGIAQAVCHVLADRGCSLILAGRAPDRLENLARSLPPSARGPHIEQLDVLAFEQHADFMRRCVRHFDGDLDGVIACVGYFPDQARAESEYEELRRTVDINFTAVASITSLFAGHMAERGQGFIAAVSSVSGDRGRGSSYIYGAAKAALNLFLQGLRGRLAGTGVHVLTIKPGWVATRMTEGIVDPSSRMVASPETVARQIVRAIERRKKMIYTPRRWRYVMGVVRLLPDPLLRRLGI